MIEFIAEESANLDTTCFRGSAKLCELARISQADVFDQEDRKTGLQRALSMRHAAEAYDYVSADPGKLPRAFPEVVLNVRDPKAVKVTALGEVEGMKLVKLAFDEEVIDQGRGVKVSRIDGNHRLYFANGDGKDREPIELLAPFQLHLGLSRDHEASLFVDINANQKGLNTSHLAILRSRLTPDEVEIIRNPARVFARRLTEDEASPFKGMVYMGGSKTGSRKKGVKHPMTFGALENAVRRMLKRSQWLQELDSADARYQLIRGYWQAVKKTWPEAFKDPHEYLLTKSIGINIMAQLGGQILDRAQVVGETDMRAFARELKAVKDSGAIDWHRDADHRSGVGGMSGNRAVMDVAGTLSRKLPKVKELVAA